MAIATAVQEDRRSVTAAHIDAARAAGLDDRDIHDVVLIAAAICMYNRYVDGLRTWTPKYDELYQAMGRALDQQGYERARGC